MKKNLFKLFLCLLAFFVFAPDAWGAKYYKIRVYAIDVNGGPTNGRVYACGYGSKNNAHNWYSDVTTGPWSDVYPQNDNGYPDIYLMAQEAEGATFVGWFSDDEHVSAIRKNTTKSVEQYGLSYTGGILTSSSDSPEDDVPTVTYYAKFTSSEPVRYYAKVHVTDADHRGAFKDRWITQDLLYVKDFTSNGTSYDESKTFSFDQPSVTAKRGYRFVQWSVEGGSFQSGANISAYSIVVNVTATSTNSAAPTTANLTGVFEALTADTLKVQKEANKGVITLSYQNYLENDDHDGLVAKVGTEEMNSSETEKGFAIYSSDQSISLTATPAEGYSFGGWYSVDESENKSFIQSDATLSIPTVESAKYYAYFKNSSSANDKYKVGEVGCATFTDALATAISSENKVIRQIKDDEIPAGIYTIPAGVTLLIPYDAEQTQPATSMTRVQVTEELTGAYRTLTLANGAQLIVYGTIEVSGRQFVGGNKEGGDAGIARTAGPTYGKMVMKPGSRITLNNGARLRAWGFVTGDGTQDETGKYVSGEIDALRGAIVTEHFQIMDWKGVANTKRMWEDGRQATYMVLPINQYYIQNVEVPTVYHPGAKLQAALGVRYDVWGVPVMDDAGIVGVRYQDGQRESDKAIFLMNDEDDSDDTWVRKYYDPTTDQQVYEANNSTYLGSLVLNMELMGNEVNVDSREYVLPITNNFKIHLMNGHMGVTQDTELLPGSEIEVNKKATLTIDPNQTLTLYDAAEWGLYVSGIQHYINTFEEQSNTFTFTYGTRLKYRPGGVPTVRDISSPEAIGNAKLTVHGTVDVKGYLRTTDSGASITSTKEDAGTVTFTTASAAVGYTHNDTIFQVIDVNTTVPAYEGQHCVSAKLKNEAGSGMGDFAQTASTPAGKSFCFIDIDEDGKGEWVSMTELQEPGILCTRFAYDQNNVYYIKPQAYVPISFGKPEEEADHTYRDHYAGTNKIYIEVQCQWWEVEETTTPGIFHCVHPQNNTYYYNDGEVWIEKKFNIYWLNYNGDTLKFTDKYNELQDHYELPYNSHPQWLSDNPTRPANANYSYTFNGWKPAITAETRVTDSVTYVAQYTEVPRQFIITFKNASSVILEQTAYDYLVTPVPPTEGVDLETYQWSPAISAVTGNQIYQLIEKPGTFTVTYKDWDGTILQTTSEITSGTTTPSCDEPSRAADALYSYTFKEWSPAVAATVTADAVYTATYNRASKNFTVRFFKEGTTNETKNAEGNLLSTQLVAYGAMPTPPAATKTSPEDHVVYTLVWSPLVAAATGDQDYIATFTEAPEQFTVTWKNGTETLAVDHVNYGVTPAYSGLTPTKEDETKIYTFTGWSPAISAVTDDQEYVAQFDEGHLKSVTVGTSDSYSTAGHVETLILKASESASGQITANVTATNAYFDLTINATTELATGATRQWHAFGVPWQVNLDTDPIQEVGGSNRTFVLGRDYDIIYYNGAKRASNGAGYWCWEFLENHLHLLQPGQGYMIAFVPSVGNVGTIRFAKKNLAPVIFNGTMTVDANTGAVANNSGWNAIANPKACKVTLDAGPTTGYVYNPATDNYSAFNIENKDYIVGKVVYIQANGTHSVVINNASGNPFVAAAPARRTEVADKEYLSLDDYYQVAIAGATTEGGHIYVLPEEGKENKYVIGHDLAQFGMSTAIPQIWVNRYNTKLALNTTALFNETAEFPMGVYAPTAGEYTICLNAQPSDEYNVYLTRDGQAIWNLSDGAFTSDLKAGIQSNYGLRLTVNKAPQVVTGVDEAVVDAKGEIRKVMINNQVYIIRGEQVYTIDGQLVK